MESILLQVTAYHSDVMADYSDLHQLDERETSMFSLNTEERVAAVQSILNCNRDRNQCIGSLHPGPTSNH